MKIRERFAIRDRVKIIIALLFLLIILMGIVLEKAGEKEVSIESFLRTALEPVGTTMYVWGGGWNDEDNGGGAGSTRIGLSPKWKRFARQQDEAYDYKAYLFEREKGLDCSGYVGWVVYNTFENESGQIGYVTTSTDMAKSFAERGWGTLLENPKEFLPGDVVSMDGHVWISLGTCEDGSVLLVHSSPPGVSVCGTQVPEEKQTAEYNGTSIAIELATDFMEGNYPEWQAKYPNRIVSNTYLENVTVMRWSEKVMQDAKQMQGLDAEEVIQRLKTGSK